MLMTLFAATVDFRNTATSTNLAGSDRSFAEWMSKLFNGVLVVGALLVLIYLLWGAIGWVTAGGDKGKIESARNKMTQAIIGLIVLASTIALYTLVQKFLGVEIFTF